MAYSMPMDAKVDHLEKLLRSKVENLSGFADAATQAYKLNAIFRFFNADRDGWLGFDEFQAAMVRLNFVGKQEEVRALFERYDTDGSGFLSYEEFSALIFGIVPNLRASAHARTALERIRAKVAERGGLNGIRSISRVMRVMDDSGDGKLSRDELKYGMRDFGVVLSERDLDTVLGILDRNGDGLVSFDELLRGLRGNLSPRRRALIFRAFEKLDRDGSGKVTLSDLRGVYDVSLIPEVAKGEKTEDQALNDFMDQWDTLEDDDIVTRDEFLDYYKDVSASIDTDDYFELMITRAWRLDDDGAAGKAAARPHAGAAAGAGMA